MHEAVFRETGARLEVRPELPVHEVALGRGNATVGHVQELRDEACARAARSRHVSTTPARMPSFIIIITEWRIF